MISLSLLGILAYTFFGVTFWQFLCWREYKTETRDPEYWEKLARWRFWGCLIVLIVFFILACLLN